MKRLLLAGLFASVTLFGQGERGAITGTVTDASGSAVPNTTIIATHLETNIETKAVTTDTGVYRMPYLSLGTYRITASAPGFKTSDIENLTLRVAQTLTVDFKLDVGVVTDKITVSAEAAQLESSTAEVGHYVSTAEFDRWPIPVSDGHGQIQSFIFRSLPGDTGSEFEGSINGGQ